MAAILSVKVFETSSLTIGVYDGLSGNHVRVADDEGYLLIAEYGFSQNDQNIKFGLWKHTKKIEEVSYSDKTGQNSGAYFIFDKKIDNISTFFKYGLADSKFNQFSENLLIGFVYDKPFLINKDNELGFAISSISNSKYYLKLNDEKGGELNFDLTYKISLSEFISIQPDFQYITNPGAHNERDYASVFTLRAEFTF